jgi:hypothetical protein
MKIDEESGTIMGSVIGAGKKNSDNSYSGVVLGEVGKVDKNGYVKDKEGILGYDHGALAFSLLNDGSATLGKSGSGQIKFDGTSGYIMSGNFNGFGNAGTPPPKNNDGTLNDAKTQLVSTDSANLTGVYIGMSTGNAYFAGTLYASEGDIGG